MRRSLGLKYYRNVILGAFFILGMSAGIGAQTGANIQGGLALMRNAAREVTAQGDQFHSGFYFGLNGRFGSYTWYFSPGAYYYRLDLFSYDEPGFFSKNDRITMIKIPIDLGARIIRTPVFNFRMYAGGIINYIESVDENDKGITIERYNDIHFGVGGGMGIDLFWLTLDVRYEKGISGLLIDNTSATSDYLTAGIGIFF